MQRKSTVLTLFVLATLGIALNSTREVHATSVDDHHRSCSVASLKGTYAFRRTGVNNVVGGPIAGIGIMILNGDGTIALDRNTVSFNGEIRDWADEPAPVGTYTVDPDCTGTFLNKTNNLVVLDGGKRYLLISVAPGTIVTEEGTRLEE
jgi:hypothetical protein